MSSSASSTERERRGCEPRSRSAHGVLSRTVARVLVATLIGMTPGGGFAQGINDSAQGAEMLTPGEIDFTTPGLVTVTAETENGATFWGGGLQLNPGETLQYDLLSEDSTHWNHVGGDFAAHLNGSVVSGPNNTLVFSSPFGVFIGSEAILDVGTLVAVGADLLDPTFSPDGPVLELTGAIENQGLIQANADVLFYGTQVRNRGSILAPNGQVLLLGAEALHFLDPDTITESLLDPVDFVAVMSSGAVENQGLISAVNASLLGGRVENQGSIEIADGSLMMIGADAVYVTQLDNPVLVRLPHGSLSATGASEAAPGPPEYRVENTGRIDAGLGHVRLAAADPLGWGIRQGTTGGTQSEPSIVARQIEIEGGEEGRVELAGRIDASATEAGAQGGSIDVTGSMIALVGAQIDASGDAGGGTIQIGGEQQGEGELQRAGSLAMDAASSVRADALRDGDGGRVILFSEDLTSIAGTVTARGGADAGDGGFIETSGLRNLQILQTPDASAPNGEAGDWLIDPYAIRVTADPPSALACTGPRESCLNRAIEAILAPNFDDAAFDGTLRTYAPTASVTSPNDLSVDLLVRALAVGTNVTLSTQAFNVVNGDPAEGDGTPGGNGDITIEAPIEIRNADVLEGTTARLALRAAGSIYVNEDITVRDAADTTTPNLSLALDFRANDQNQRAQNLPFGSDQLRGSVELRADIRTGGGDFTASGISIDQAAGFSLETDGGDVEMVGGSTLRDGLPAIFGRDPNNPGAAPVPTTSSDPGIRIDGLIDTGRPDDDPDTGGAISLIANAIQIQSAQSLSVDTGVLTLTGTLASGGGDILASGGTRGTNFAGNVDITGGTIQSEGGAVAIDSNRVDAIANSGSLAVSFVDSARGEGGAITATGADVSTSGGLLTIGSASTRTIALDGDFDTLDATGEEDGLLAILAADAPGTNVDAGRYGRGGITLAANSATTLSSAGISLSAREITTGPNGLTLRAEGRSEQAIDGTSLGLSNDGNPENDPDFAAEREVAIDSGRRIDLGAGTQILAEAIRIRVATDPTFLNAAESDAFGQLIPAEAAILTRLTFGGAGGTSAGSGVRLSGDDIAISIGNGITISPGLAFEPVVEDDLVTPNAFGLERGTRGDFSGLQLRSFAGGQRPERFSLRQDGDLTISEAAPTADGEIFFGGRSGSGSTTGAFANAAIGALGQTLSLESSDGVLVVEDAAGLNDDVAALPGVDAGASRVDLHGGLLLDDVAGAAPGDSVRFFDPLISGTAFDLRALTISTPRDLTISAATARAVAAVDDLAFQAGRNTGVEGAAQDGTLSVEESVFLQASDRLSLHAGASGFGDLVFETSTPPLVPATRLASSSLELRAGAGQDSLNGDPAQRSAIRDLPSIDLRDANDADFVSRGATALAFSYRQDAAIDAATDLPTFDNFTSTSISSFNGAGAITPVAYSLRSDFGSIDLTTDATDGARFTDAALSLVGLETAVAAIEVDDDFSFVGPAIELGGVVTFTYTQRLAEIFNPTAVPAEARERVTLRAGLNDPGLLVFENLATVTAGRIELVAGDGSGGDVGSRVVIAGGRFDLSGAATGERTFVYQEDEDLQLVDLPTNDQFIGGLPNIMAVRDDGGLLDLIDFDVTNLRDRFEAGVQARLILEADTIELIANDGGDLILTDEATDLGLRLRANLLRLEALIPGVTTERGRVIAGGRSGDTPPAGPQNDAAFSGESLLIEAFDPTRELATTTNLSTASQTDEMPDMWNLTNGRGPTTIVLDQDGAVTPADLPDRLAISGNLERSLDDEPDGTWIPTTYSIASLQESIILDPGSVNGSTLVLGSEAVPLLRPISFESGSYALENVGAYTSDSIFIAAGVDMSADETITLAAALLTGQPAQTIDDSNPMGQLVFEGASASMLSANRIALSAGPDFTVTNPGGTGVPIVQTALAQIDFSGLDSLAQTGDSETAIFSARQSRAFDTRIVGGPGDVSGPLVTGSGGWDSVELASTQGALILANPEALAPVTDDLLLGSLLEDASVVIEPSVADPFSAFANPSEQNGQIRIEADDLTFVAAPGVELALDSPNLRVAGSTFRTFFDARGDLGRVGSDPNALDRPIVRVEQSGDFSATRLIRADRYLRPFFDPFTGITEEITRESLSQLEIQLVSTGNSFVFGDSLREGAWMSNLVVEVGGGAAADVLLSLGGLAPGYRFDDFSTPDLEATDFAALQLTSLELDSGDGAGTITIGAFSATTPGAPLPNGDLTIETTGDQLFSGQMVLEDTLSTDGRDLRFTGDIYRDSSISLEDDAGLIVQTAGEVFFEEDIGTSSDSGVATDPSERLGKLFVLFDSDVRRTTPAVQFGRRADLDGDGIDETPVISNQLVLTDADIVFATADLNEADNPQDPNDGNLVADFRASIENAADLDDLDAALAGLGIGRSTLASYATIGKSAGNLSFLSAISGHFVMASGERLAVGGDIDIDVADGVASLGDVSSLSLRVSNASQIGLVRRNSGVTLGLDGSTTKDGGASILANTIDFGGLPPQLFGIGKDTRFGLPNPYDPALPAFLGQFAAFAMLPSGGPLDVGFFSFAGSELVPSLVPRGASRSELSGAFGPTEVPRPTRENREAPPLTNAERLAELDVDARETPERVRIARLRGAAIIDDLAYAQDAEDEGSASMVGAYGETGRHRFVSVTDARLDAADTEDAIRLYEELFGPDGARAGEVRATLQEALDQYLETTRARRVIGFELRRFVKNRPSTLLQAYQTLDRLDTLFRYHRRLGLSPGEYRRIQTGWLEQIQPDGITIDELSEAIHPSRYVRGSDILDIFGR